MLTFPVVSRTYLIVTALISASASALFICLPILNWVSIIEGPPVLAAFMLAGGAAFLYVPFRFLWRDTYQITISENGLVTFHRVFGSTSIPASSIRSVSLGDRAFGLGEDAETMIRFEHAGGKIDTTVFPAKQLVDALRKFSPGIISTV